MSSSQHQKNDKTKSLELKLSASDRNEQKIVLENRKATIGSHKDCSVVLDSETVKPVHCMVIQGQAGTVIRNFHADTRVNGESVGDQWFESGDTLAMGGVELRHDHGAENRESDPSAGSTPDLAANSQQIMELIDRLAGLESEVDHLKQSRSEFEQRATDVECELEEKLQRVSQLENDKHALQGELHQANQLSQSIQDLERQSEAAIERSNELESKIDTQDEVIRQFAVKNCELAGELIELRNSSSEVNEKTEEATSEQNDSLNVTVDEQPATETDSQESMGSQNESEEADSEPDEFNSHVAEFEKIFRQESMTEAEGDSETNSVNDETSTLERDQEDASSTELADPQIETSLNLPTNAIEEEAAVPTDETEQDLASSRDSECGSESAGADADSDWNQPERGDSELDDVSALDTDSIEATIDKLNQSIEEANSSEPSEESHSDDVSLETPSPSLENSTIEENPIDATETEDDLVDNPFRVLDLIDQARSTADSDLSNTVEPISADDHDSTTTNETELPAEMESETDLDADSEIANAGDESEEAEGGLLANPQADSWEANFRKEFRDELANKAATYTPKPGSDEIDEEKREEKANNIARVESNLADLFRPKENDDSNAAASEEATTETLPSELQDSDPAESSVEANDSQTEKSDTTAPEELEFNFELAESNLAGAFSDILDNENDPGNETDGVAVEYSESDADVNEFSEEQAEGFFEAVQEAENANPYAAFLDNEESEVDSTESPFNSESVDDESESPSGIELSSLFQNQSESASAEESESEPTDGVNEEIDSAAGLSTGLSTAYLQQQISEDEAETASQNFEASAPKQDAGVQESKSDDSDDSYIQEYMKRLLGNNESESEVANEPESENKPSLLEKTFEREIKERQEMLKPSEFVPKTSAPERNSNLKAMRELANQSARSAIETSSRKRKFEQQSTLVLIFAGICFFIGASLAMISKSMMSLPTIGSVFFFALTGIGAWYYFDLKNTGKNGAKEGAEEKPEAELKPADVDQAQ